MRRAIGAAVSLAVVALGNWGCQRGDGQPGTWSSVRPERVQRTGLFADDRLTESSGVAASRRYPGVLWTHNDSGNPPRLFATDTTGAALGRWALDRVSNRDWEEIALGPCPAGTCLYIGDVGDNGERRESVVLHRFPEPDPAGGAAAIAGVESLVVTYPDRARDVEAMYVDARGDTWLVSKGRTDGFLHYRVPATSWSADTAIAELIDTLPLPPGRPTHRLVTGAALAPDGERLVVRTYRDLYLFRLTADGRAVPAAGPNQCGIAGLAPQGEAVDWWDEETLVLTSERARGGGGSIHLVRCPWGAAGSHP